MLYWFRRYLKLIFKINWIAKENSLTFQDKIKDFKKEWETH